MRRLLLAVPLFFSSLICSAQPSTQVDPKPASADKLPITRVVLYKNGVGYFEHLGHARGNEEFQINFTTAQLNDVLKSLAAVDFGGGQVTDVRYNSIAPLSQRLSTLRIQLDENTSQAALLTALRGARVEVKNGASAAIGRLLSVEKAQRELPASRLTIEVTEVALVTDSGEMRKFELTPATSVRVLEADLNKEVGRYLQLIASSRAKDVRQMNINTLGTGERDFMVSYISEVPVWKSTYRLLLPKKTDDKPFLQGWAIIDNTVGEDWKDVQLSLVAGAPQSFIQQISQPLYTRRPTVALPQSAMLTPQTHEGTLEAIDASQVQSLPLNGRDYSALAQLSKGVSGGRLSGGTGSIRGTITDQSGAVIVGANVTITDPRTGASNSATSDSQGNYVISGIPGGTYRLEVRARAFREYSVPRVQIAGGAYKSDVTLSIGAATEMVAVEANPTPISAEDLEKTVKIESDNGALGDLFQYAPKQKITVLQNQSAMVPIVSSRMEAEKVTLWNSQERLPLRALWLKNTTGFTLDGGTFNILDDGAFAGEGLLDELKPNERRLLSYAYDNPVRIRAEATTKAQPYTRVRIAKGQMSLTRELRASTRYTIHNSDTAPRQVVIEHPINDGYKIVGGAKPEESSATLHRFVVKVEPGKTSELAVEEAHPEESTYELSDFDRDEYTVLIKDLKPTPALDKIFKQLLGKQDEIAAVEKQLETLNAENNRITTSQSRLRENMKALKGSSEEKALLQRYVGELNEQENRINALDKQIEQVEANKEKLEGELKAMMQAIMFEEAL